MAVTAESIRASLKRRRSRRDPERHEESNLHSTGAQSPPEAAEAIFKEHRGQRSNLSPSV